MPLTAPDSYELDDSQSPPLLPKRSFASDSDDSEVNELDPLQRPDRPYTDDAHHRGRPILDGEKNDSFTRRPLAWLDTQRSRGGWRQWFVPSRFFCFLILLFIVTLILLLSVGGIWVYNGAVPSDGQSDPWYPTPRGGALASWADAYKKAAKLVGEMTLVEKVNITTGTGWMMDLCVGSTGRVDRLAFPSLCLQDGPLGLRFVQNATAWPAGVTVAATWNPELMYERGKAHGFEAKKKGVNVLLGPSMGPLGRLPAGGRNWEGFGPDPYLQGIAAAETIKGIQEEGVIATAKHFVGNEQEHFRQSWEWATPNAISSNMDDRTLHEIYAWPFADSVKAGVGSVMCSYNQLNNSYACQNSKLINGILKDEMGFQGFVQSDWLAQRSGVASALAGLDMSMPGDGLKWEDRKSLWAGELTKAVLNTSVPLERLNDMVLRVVATWYQLGQDDTSEWPALSEGGGPNFSSWTSKKTGKLHPGSPDGSDVGTVNRFVPVRNTTEGGDHDALARKIAAEGIVMVKNEDDILPLNRNRTGIPLRLGNDGDGKVKIGIFGEDAFANPKGNNACPDRACNEGTLAMGWGSGAVELPYLVAPFDALSENFDDQTVELTKWASNDIEHVESTAAEQDVCIAFISSDAGEGFRSWNGVKGDRNNLFAQKGGDTFVEHVAINCRNTIVVLHTVGPTILEKWIDLPGVKAVLIAHLPGQESGNALADVIFGDVNPSGHLPYTIAKREEDYGPDSGIMRLPNSVVPQQNFTEALYVDYRYFDKHNITPRYEFGFGLSYTQFRLSSLVVQPLGSPGKLPEARPGGIDPPSLGQDLPSAESALMPSGMKRLKEYIYPYIDSVSSIKKGQYPYPKGYGVSQPLSPAGGGEGGNPDLWEPVAKVRATASNTGSVAGDAVVQMYISFPANIISPYGKPVDTPVKVLRGFKKIHIPATERGKRKEVEMILTRRDLSYWDVDAQNWILPLQGDFTAYLGFSSRQFITQTMFSPGGLFLDLGGGGSSSSSSSKDGS